MKRLFDVLAVFAISGATAFAVDTPSEVAHSISTLRLDATQCYRLTNVAIKKGPLSIHLDSGWIVFAEPVRGVRPGAVYISSPDSNHIALAPTSPSERLALERALHRTAIDESFGRSLMLFTDGTDVALMADLVRQQAPKDNAKGAALAQEWTSIFAHIADSFHTRLVRDLAGSDRSRGVFYIGVSTPTIGDFDIFYDSDAVEEAVAGRLKAGVFDIIAACCEPKTREPAATIAEYSINATFGLDLKSSVVTKAKVRIGRASTSVLAFSLSDAMKVARASVDGAPAAVFQSQSLQSKLLRDDATGELLILAPTELRAGSVHEIRIEHQGDVIRRLSNDEFMVGARQDWYPRLSELSAAYDLTFHFPPDLTMIASGKKVAEFLDGTSRVSQWKTELPIRFATFNIGQFNHLTTKVQDVTTDVYFPDNLAADSLVAERITEEALSVIRFMNKLAGAFPAMNLLVSPSPGALAQNLSGHVFLPSSFYTQTADNKNGGSFEQRLRIEIAIPHEIAHEWWGNSVRPATYHDEWITEALANYSALLYLEQNPGTIQPGEALVHYRAALTQKTLDAGPVTWGYRLLQEDNASKWRALTYGKGSLIFHQIRTMMGEEGFNRFLQVLFAEYRGRALSTGDLERLVARYTSDERAKSFFDLCVNGTAMP